MDGIDIEQAKGRMVKIQYPFGQEDVFFYIDSYAFEGNLYVGLLCIEDGAIEPFADITRNIPGEVLAENEAYLANDFVDTHLLFILENELGKVVGRRQNGFATFTKVAFDLEKLKGLDPDGLARHLENRKRSQAG